MTSSFCKCLRHLLKLTQSIFVVRPAGVGYCLFFRRGGTELIDNKIKFCDVGEFTSPQSHLSMRSAVNASIAGGDIQGGRSVARDPLVKRSVMTATGSVAALPASIYQHGQSTLPDGRVFVSGSRGNGGGYTNKSYIYTPNRNIWEEAATLATGIGEHGQSALVDGRILISGGRYADFSPLNTTYIYDFVNDSLISASPMPASFFSHGQSTLSDGRVMVSGGHITISTAYLYNTSINIWTNASPMPAGFYGHGQSILSNSKTLISGGAVDGGWNSPRNIVYTYESTGNKWATAAPLLVALAGHGQSTLFDGRVLVSGGNGTNGKSYIYTTDNSNGSWVSVSPMPVGAYLHGQSTLADGRVLISGGTQNDSNGFSTAYIYTPTGWED